MEAEKIAAGLTKAQREAPFFGVGHRRVPKAVIALAELGLVTTHLMRVGWGWRPTPLGLAVKTILERKP
jgi:hypothetical protein